MKVSDTVRLRSEDGSDRAEIEIKVESRDGEQAVAWLEAVADATERALPDGWR